LLTDVAKSLLDSVNVAKIKGLKQNDIILDPGFGFGKNVQQNLTLLNHLDYFSQLGYPLMIGTSRKSAIGSVLNSPIDDRLEGTAATIAVAIAKGVDIVRIHDVVSIAKTVKMTDAIIRGID
jgi:dihydropteroate synthase